jgi:hypothetical protein
LWIGVKLIAEDEGGEGEHEIAASDKLFAAVKTVIIADLVMSIDNVIGVAGAAKGSLILLIFGLVVSIPLVVVGSQLIMKLVERMPWLVIAGGGTARLYRRRNRHRGRDGEAVDHGQRSVAPLRSADRGDRDRCRRRLVAYTSSAPHRGALSACRFAATAAAFATRGECRGPVSAPGARNSGSVPLNSRA